MNSSRCSDLVVLVLLLVLTVGAAGGVTVNAADAPSGAEVGTDRTATFELAELYQDPEAEQWTLRGETELENVTWTVNVIDQAGSQIAQPTYVSQSFAHDVDIESGAAQLEITLTGTVPPITNFTYDPQPSFLVAELIQEQPGGTTDTIETYEADRYTADSQAARQAIDAARAAINEAGGPDEAERTLDSAIDAYESENFDLAVDLAEQAKDTARQAEANQSRNRLILLAVGALVLLGIVVGAVVYWRRSRTHSRL
ncbi:MAG: hypothetical protein ABEH59_01170 [Halobacteriales archaeon]